MTAALDLVVDVIHRRDQAVGRAADRTAGRLERAAELLRWLAAATRAAP